MSRRCPDCENDGLTVVLDIPYCPKCEWAGKVPVTAA